MHTLTEALAHLRAFRDSFDAGDVIDEQSCLSADDLTWLIEALEAVEDGMPASANRTGQDVRRVQQVA